MEHTLQTDFVKNRELLFQYALGFTRDLYNAEDLLHETALKVFQADPNRFKYGSNFIGWVYMIMRNTFINDYRKRSRESKLFDEIDDSPSDMHLYYSSVKNRADDHFLGQDLSKAFQKLNPIYLEAFLMYFEGYKYKEIAQHLGVAEGTIKTRIHSARKSLKIYLSMHAT